MSAPTRIDTSSVLLRKPSDTDTRNTSVPLVAGAVNVGLAAVGDDSVTAVPETCVHEYDSASPSASVLALASSVTPAPACTPWSGPAFAVGAVFVALIVTVSTSVKVPSLTSTLNESTLAPDGTGNVGVAVVDPVNVTIGVVVGLATWYQV